MPELRKDPVIGRWVIISTERARRPQSCVAPVPAEKRDEVDPFLPGNEHMTPPELLAYRPAGSRPNTPGWWVRVIPNKFPALESTGEVQRRGDGMYDLMNGIGSHEVVIENADPDLQLPDMTVEQVQEVIWAFRDRSVALRRDNRFRYIQIFKNYGAQAGASIWHPHSQIIALPIVPKNLQEKLDGAKSYYDYKERCVYTDIVDQELKDGVRIIDENDSFVSFCPFASAFPFEISILSKTHQNYFADISKKEVVDLSKILRATLRKLKFAVNDPAYNLVIHTTPDRLGPVPYFSWHIEILPALNKVAGFEWGSGFFINPLPPEDAAEFLRTAELPQDPEQETEASRRARERQATV